MMDFWMVYFKHYGKVHNPMESDPNTYSRVAVFGDELEALRYANEVSGKCIPYNLGERIEDLA